MKRVARTPEGRDLIRSLKKQPGGTRVLKALYRDKDRSKKRRERSA
jgi:hypothetical protein